MGLEELNYYGKHRTPCVFIIDFEGVRAHILPASEAEKKGLCVQTPLHALPTNEQENLYFDWKTTPPDIAKYQLAYQIVYENLFFGNSYLLNLSAPTLVETNLSLRQIFQASQASYKVLFEHEAMSFVCFSPETFVRLQAGKIFSFPMKGTIDATLPNAKKIILHDQKELAEHYTIVDLIRNDLSQVAKQVRVKRFRYLDTIYTHAGKALLQVSSEVVGNLPKNYLENLGDILATLLPAGSISGAPKKKTVEIIKNAESIFQYTDQTPYQRDFYTGICGYFDGETVDTGVMIRFIQQVGRDLYFKSGGGITTQSTLESEYHELIQKVYVPIFTHFI
jgi:para-aminobenzoate synthetase component 1